MQSVNSSDVLDVGLGRLVLAVCLLLGIAVVVPAGLTWMARSSVRSRVWQRQQLLLSQAALPTERRAINTNRVLVHSPRR